MGVLRKKITLPTPCNCPMNLRHELQPARIGVDSVFSNECPPCTRTVRDDILDWVGEQDAP